MTDQVQQSDDVRELGLYDERNPLSLLTLLVNNKELTAAIKSLPYHLLGAPERSLRKGYKPCDMVERIKIKFWEEYDAAQKEHRSMVMANVIDLICSKTHFYNKIMNNVNALAWIISPPTDHLHVQKQLYGLGMEKMREILELDLIEKVHKVVNGKNKVERRYNTSLMKIQMAITQNMENRIYGAVIQRQQSLSVHKEIPASTEPGEVTADNLSLKEIEKQLNKIKRLKKDIKELPEGEAEIVDGEVEDGEPSDED